MDEIEVSLPRKVPSEAHEHPDIFMSSKETVMTKIGGLTPAFKKKVKRKAETKAIEDKTITGYNVFEVKQPPYNLNYLSRLYEINPYNYAAINAKVVATVGQGYDFVESPTLKEKMESISSDTALDKARKRFLREKRMMNEWVDTLHPYDEFMETLAKFFLDYEVTGNGYLEIGREITGKIGYVGHIPSETVRVRAKRDGFIQIVGNKAVFFRNFGDTETSDPIGGDGNPNEILHIKNYSPTNMFYGVPRVIAAKNAVAGAEFSAQYNLDYFENKAIPRYIVTLKGGRLSEEAERRLLEFLQGVKGRAGNHRTVYIPLPEDTPDSKVELELVEVENKIQDSSFNNYRKSSRDEILAAQGVPITKVSVAEGVSLAIARDADKTFSENVVKPAQSLLSKKINRIIKEVTDALIIKFNEISLTDADTQSKIWERLLRMQVLVPNEVRADLGRPSLEGGDDVVDLKAPTAAEQTEQASGNRRRDQERSGNSPDTSGEARQPKGDGRAQD